MFKKLQSYILDFSKKADEEFQQAELSLSEDEEKQNRISFPFRIDAANYRYIKTYANHLGVSLPDVANMMLTGVRLQALDGAKENDTIINRVFEIFKEQGISTVDMATFLNEINPNIDLSTLSSAKELLKQLGANRAATLTKLAELFNLNIDWLKANSNTKYNHDYNHYYSRLKWYKSTDVFIKTLLKIYFSHNKPRLNLKAVKDRSVDPEKATLDNELKVGFYLEIEQNFAGVHYTKYFPGEIQNWGYEKSRRYFKLAIALCEELSQLGVSIDVTGYNIDRKNFTGEYYQKMPAKSTSIWYPDDYVGIKFKVYKDVEEWKELESNSCYLLAEKNKIKDYISILENRGIYCINYNAKEKSNKQWQYTHYDDAKTPLNAASFDELIYLYITKYTKTSVVV